MRNSPDGCLLKDVRRVTQSTIPLDPKEGVHLKVMILFLQFCLSCLQETVALFFLHYSDHFFKPRKEQ